MSDDQTPEEFPSTSDERSETNNLMRHNYRPLTDEEKQNMVDLKDKGLDFVRTLYRIGGTNYDEEISGSNTRQASRELSLAQTKIEEAVMWAVKHVTG